ncbi:MAG: hypothetical protein ACXVY5_09455, partial [Gaiellales bacterium]
AAHYLAAYDADRDAADAADVRRRAGMALVRAGDRAASLAANHEAEHYFEQAAELADDALEQARLLERAGVMARNGASSAEALAHFERAMALFEQAGATHPAARVSARLGEVMWDTGRLKEALERMDTALGLLSAEEPDADLAALAAQVARFRFFAGEPDVAAERIETALELAETLRLPEVLSQAINTKAMLLSNRGRMGEAGALVHYALEVALEHDIPSAALRGYNNGADLLARSDRYEQAAAGYIDGLALARRVGNRQAEWQFLGQIYPLYALGRWDEALAQAAELPDEGFAQTRFPYVCLLGSAVGIHTARGDLDVAERLIVRYAELGESADLSERSAYVWARAALLQAQGRAAEALPVAEACWEMRDAVGVNSEGIKEAFPIAVAAALTTGEADRADHLLSHVEAARPGRLPQFLRAHALRFRARMAAAAGDADRAVNASRGAAGLFRELAMPFPMAVTLLEHAEWLRSPEAADEAGSLLAEARGVFDGLGARPWLARCARVSGERVAV